MNTAVGKGIAASGHRPMSRSEERQVVIASTMGTLFEWYDFFIYGTLAVFMSQVLFPQGNPTVSLLAALGALAVGFIIRPLGAVLFGYLGDKLGRKVTFLATVVMMGGATVLIGCLPTYESAGHLSWILLLTLRVIQGLAVGGEYGGAVIYVAEHCEPRRRGLLTGWIQITSSAGLILSLLVILATQASMSPEDFRQWGWRLPFILSIVMLALSVYVRSKLHESPVFLRMKQEKRLAGNPVKETFGRWSSLRLVLIALVGVTAGQGATYFTGQFYVMIFLQQAVQLSQTLVYEPGRHRLPDRRAQLRAVRLALRPHRPQVDHGGRPVHGRPELPRAVRCAARRRQSRARRGHADHPGADPCGHAGRPLRLRPAGRPGGRPPRPPEALRAGEEVLRVPGRDLRIRPAAAGPGAGDDRGRADRRGLRPQGLCPGAGAGRLPPGRRPGARGPLAHHRPAGADDGRGGHGLRPGGRLPGGAVPPRIRYTALSFPYHIGAGIVGGIVPFTATYLAQASGNIFGGLMYPVAVTAVVGVLGCLLLPNTPARAIDADTAP